MTKEERAVEILKNELACVRNVDCERSECRNCNLVMPEHDITEALQMAIKALEQEPCEDVELTNGEYIEKIVEQDEGYCILKDYVAGTVTIEVSLEWWNKSQVESEVKE